MNAENTQKETTKSTQNTQNTALESAVIVATEMPEATPMLSYGELLEAIKIAPDEATKNALETQLSNIENVLSEKAIKADVAMTGELTLSGKVLPIGGLKEKLIAAYKAKMKKALIPRKNFERDLDEIPQEVKDSMEIKAVDVIEDVLKEALV